MDTEKQFILKESIVNTSYENLPDNDLQTSRHHVEITRHLQEIRHLFLIVKYNIMCLQQKYTLFASGDVACGQKAADSGDDFIAINACVTNIISSGRTLAESMECYINTNPNLEDGAKKQYFDHCHGIYDNSFAYRLLIRLRDYSQHGHLPVSNMNNNYYFDLIQIAEKPHFNHNKAIKAQMEQVIQEVKDVYNNTPTLSLTATVAEFVAKLFSVYSEFWRCVEKDLIGSYTKFQEIIEAYPENILIYHGAPTGLFIYDSENGMIHVVHIADNAKRMFEEFKTEADNIHSEYQEAFESLMQSSFWVKCIDKKRMEIGIGLPIGQSY